MDVAAAGGMAVEQQAEDAYPPMLDVYEIKCLPCGIGIAHKIGVDRTGRARLLLRVPEIVALPHSVGVICPACGVVRPVV